MDASKTLPNELWLQVFGYLSKADLKALRLTAEPHMSMVASSLLFTTAYIAARRRVLHTFTSLTTHPVFRHYVKEIIFDSSYIDPAKFTEHPDGEVKATLTKLFQEQEKIQTNNELQTRLEDAFKCLSKVKKVCYADLFRISYLSVDCSDTESRCDYLDGPLIRRLESNHDPREIDCCCLAAETSAGCPCHDDQLQHRRKIEGLVLLLQVLSEYASTTLLELSLGDTTHSYKDGGIPHWFLISKTGITTLHCFSNIFHNLRKFELSVSFPDQADVLTASALTAQLQYIGRLNGGDLSKLLSSAENLEELKISGDTKLCITNTLATHTWPRLRVLHLKDFEASASELEGFLKRHAASLRSMTLDFFHLTTGSWLDIAPIVEAVAPGLEFILGFVWAQRDRNCTFAIPGLSSADLDVSGPRHSRYIRTKKDDDAEEETSSEELDYSSDDSSPETDEPRRKRETVDPALRSWLLERHCL